MKFSLISLILLIIVLLILATITANITSTHTGQSATSDQSSNFGQSGTSGLATTSDQIVGESSSSCFIFSDVTSKETKEVMGTVYEVQGKVTNTCMKNFGQICVNTTFYDSDNMVVASQGYLIQQMQHGTTVPFIAQNYYHQGAGTNKAVRQFLKAYEWEFSSKVPCF